MRMKNRYCRMGKSLLRAVCLLSICGFTYSCSDDYDLDETRPPFLGESIYDELKATGKFTNVVRLIDDLEYANVLSKTASLVGNTFPKGKSTPDPSPRFPGKNCPALPQRRSPLPWNRPALPPLP